MLLQRVDASSRNLGVQLVQVIKMSPVRDMVLRCGRLNLDADAITTACDLDVFLILFDSSHATYLQEVLLWDTDWRARLELTAMNFDTEDEGVLLANDILLLDFHAH